MDSQEKIVIIERNHQEHFAYLPNTLGFASKCVEDVIVTSSGFGSSMFNLAFGAPRDKLNYANAIQLVKVAFNGQPFAWWVPPSQRDEILTKDLLAAGLSIETTEHAMFCDLNALDIDLETQKADLKIQAVMNQQSLGDFISVLEPYDQYVRPFYEKLKDEQLALNEKLFVGYVNQKPVTISVLYVSKNSAGIFSLLTNEDAQGQGYGTDMMRHMLKMAKQSGCESVTLSASSDSGFRIYERLGFEKVGEFECFEY